MILAKSASSARALESVVLCVVGGQFFNFWRQLQRRGRDPRGAGVGGKDPALSRIPFVASKRRHNRVVVQFRQLSEKTPTIQKKSASAGEAHND